MGIVDPVAAPWLRGCDCANNRPKGDPLMIRLMTMAAICAVVTCVGLSTTEAGADENAYGRVWGGNYNLRDWERFYHYPYVYYPQNFWGNEYYRSSESLYYRYPPEMRIPVYNKKWHNYYPEGELQYRGNRYHQGKQFLLDIF